MITFFFFLGVAVGLAIGLFARDVLNAWDYYWLKRRHQQSYEEWLDE